MAIARLTVETFSQALGWLAERDADLAQIISRWGDPPFWRKEPGFPALVHVILTQQVSLASADAAYFRLLEAIKPLSPENFLTLDDHTLKGIGFSRQKAGYVRGLSKLILEGELDLDGLATLEDGACREILLRVKGIGSWTADTYLLMALRRPDVWPVGDLALAVAVQKLKDLPGRPDGVELTEIGEAWRPWRAVAARMLWHDYLSERARV